MLERWRRRENLLPGLALAALAGAGWVYTAYRAGGMEMEPGLAAFAPAWVAMMAAMMLPATLPLLLIHRTITRKNSGRWRALAGTAALLAGYLAVWTAAGLPVYAHDLLMAGSMSPLVAALPGLLLVAGGVYQFTALKQGCHIRCSSPLFFLMSNWRPGARGSLRLGARHGLDCLGCCAGLMAGLVALGMMDLVWVLTAALIIFAEKTISDGHRIAKPLGVLMVIGGAALLAAPLLGGTGGMAPM